MDIQLVKGLHEWANSMSIKPDLGQRVFHLQGINEIKNGIIKLSESIAKSESYFSKDLFRLKDILFIGAKLEVLKLFVASAAIHKDKTFNLYFNDYSEERISVLKEVIAKVYKTRLPNLHIYISQKDVNEYLSCLSRETKRFLYPQATILYVDPYDFGTVHIPTLRTFCEKFYCELLFNLFTSDWVRNRNNELDSRIVI